MTPARPKLLLVDDDEVFCHTLMRALQRKGYEVQVAHSLEQASTLVPSQALDYAVIDLCLGKASGLTLVNWLHQQDPNIRLLVLTGYASIATAVDAIKLGATQYLAKPATVEQIIGALHPSPVPAVLQQPAPPPAAVMSVQRLEWEHIQQVLKGYHGNISATARALNMHRRTLQRKLQKYSPKQ